MSFQRINTAWRILATGISFVVFGVGAFLIGLSFFILVPLPIDQPKKQRWIRCSIRGGCQFYIQMMRTLGLLSFSIDVQHANQGQGQLIIANHPTLLDAIFMLSAMDELCCIVKESLWQNPLTVTAVSLAGYIPNNSATLIEQANEKLARGENILIFPEGTRNTYNDQLDFKRGAANIAIAAACPIVPIVIGCEPRTLQKHEKWHEVPKSPPHFSLQSHNTIHIQDCIDTTKPRTVQYRHLTDFLIEYYRPHLSSPTQHSVTTYQ